MAEKSFGLRFWDFLGSRNFSIFIFVMGLTYVLFLVVFSMVVPLPWVSNIAKLLPFKVLYLLFFVNLLICEIKWIPVIVRKCKKPSLPSNLEDLERFRHKIIVSHEKLNTCDDLKNGKIFPESEFGTRRLIRYLRRRLFRVQVSEENGSLKLIHAYRGRLSPIGNLLFHGSFLFLFAGVILSMLFRFEGRVKVTEGYPFSGIPQAYQSISMAPFASAPSIPFFLEKIIPTFWRDQLLFTDLKADIKYNEGGGSLRMSSPLMIDRTSITIHGIGLTPMYVLKNREGHELDVGYVNLGIFTPGSEDHFQIPGFPHEIFVSFYPDFAQEGNKFFNRSMNVKNPRYFVKVFRGRIPVFSGLLKPGEEAEFENLRISFPEFRYWGDFRIIKDPGLVFVWTAFILFGLGLVWRLLFYRREIAVVTGPEKFTIYGNSDYYPGLFENRLKMLKRIVEA